MSCAHGESKWWNANNVCILFTASDRSWTIEGTLHCTAWECWVANTCNQVKKLRSPQSVYLYLFIETRSKTRTVNHCFLLSRLHLNVGCGSRAVCRRLSWKAGGSWLKHQLQTNIGKVCCWHIFRAVLRYPWARYRTANAQDSCLGKPSHSLTIL